MIQAVIFDMDGLMFDTERMFKALFSKLLKDNHIECPNTVIEDMIGCDSRLILKYEEMYPGITKTMEECQRKRESFFRDFFPEPGQANKPGLQALMEYLEAKQVPYAIASGSDRSSILSFISQAGFPICTDTVISTKEGYPSKPAPDLFLAAASKMGVRSEDCLVLEDSKHGIHAAYRAQMKSIFVPDQILPDEEMKQYIQYQAKDLFEVKEMLEKTGFCL